MVTFENIFRTYDIRGKIPQDFNLNAVIDIGKAFGTFFGEKKNVIIGGDVRLTTPAVKTALALGLMETGCNVKDIGICTTPTIYYLSVNNDDVDYGVMVTASHNPIDYNGLKVCDQDGVAFHFDNFFSKILQTIIQRNFSNIESQNYGQIPKLKNVNSKQYWDYLKNNFQPQRDVKLVVDIGNGTCYPFLEILKDKNIQSNALHSEPDGTFPVMIPDPAKSECLQYLISEVKRNNYDLAIGFDADGDRVGFVDEKGVIIKPDQVIMLFGKSLLDKYPNQELLIDIKTSRATYEYLTDLGAKVRFTKVGHSWIHEEVLRSGAIFAGELSGHYYFGKDYFGFDDAAYASLRMIEILSSQEDPISHLVNSLPIYQTSEEMRIPCDDRITSIVVQNVKKKLLKEAQHCITIDGIRAEFENGWVLVRKSGTEPVLSLRAEGYTSNDQSYYTEFIKEIVNKEIERETKNIDHK